MVRVTFIGEAIRREKEAAGLSNKRLAEQTGLSQQYVGDVQRGLRVPPVETMLKFSNLFPNVDPAWWCWLLLRDTWGNEIAQAMRSQVLAMHRLGEESS